MAPRTLPGIGLRGYWALGEDGWNDEHDEDLRKLSAIAQPVVLSRTDVLPGSPTDGMIYIVPDGTPTTGNQIAIRDNGAWAYLTPAEGWTAYVVDDEENVQFDGTDWVEFAAGGAGATNLDDLLNVNAPTPSDDDVLTYDSGTSMWIAAPAAGVGAAELSIPFFIGGSMDDAEIVFSLIAVRAFDLPASLTGSYFSAVSAATSSQILTIKKNGSSIGTLTWAAAGTVPTKSFASLVAFLAGDILSLTAAATADPTLADVSGNFLADI